MQYWNQLLQIVKLLIIQAPELLNLHTFHFYLNY